MFERDDGSMVELTVSESRLLASLVPDKTVSYRAICRAVWDSPLDAAYQHVIQITKQRLVKKTGLRIRARQDIGYVLMSPLEICRSEICDGVTSGPCATVVMNTADWS